MSDIDQGRNTKDTGNIGERAYINSLSDELILALQEIKTSSKKQQKLAPKHLVKTEHEGKPASHNILTAREMVYNRRIQDRQLVSALHPQVQSKQIEATLHPQVQSKQVEGTLLPQPKVVDTPRTIVDSAVSLLRTGFQKVADIRLRSDNSTALTDMKNVVGVSRIAQGNADIERISGNITKLPPALAPAQDAALPVKTNLVESGKLKITSYRVDAPSMVVDARSQSDAYSPSNDHKEVAGTNKLKEVVIDYGCNSTSAAAALLSSNFSNIIDHNTSLPDTSTRIASPQPSRATESTYSGSTTTPVRSGFLGAKDTERVTEQVHDYSKGTVASITSVSETVKPNSINVAINVRSFSVDGHVKPLLLNPMPCLPTLRTMQPQLGPLYRTPTPYGSFNIESETITPESSNNKFQASDKHYALGTEIALAAITAAAGTSRRRMETSGGKHKSQAEKAGTGVAADKEESAVAEATSSKAMRKRPTMLIGQKDNLIRIAEGRFDDANLCWLIAALNKNVSNQVELDGKYLVEFESRQEIVLPVWDDIVEFYESHKGPFNNSRLITIVNQTMVDQELLEATLGPLFDS